MFYKKDYENLINKSVNIEFSSEENKKEYLEVCNELNSIIEKNICVYDNEQEKLDKITCYILENLKYDKKLIKIMIKRK